MPRCLHAHTPVAVAAALMLVPYLQTTAIAAEATTAAASDVVMLSADATRVVGRWVRESDATAAGGSRLRHPDGGAAKVPGALASPADFFELTFSAEAGRGYRLWVRGRADRNSWANDSVYVQFSNSVTDTGAAAYRIGSTSGAMVSLEECVNCGVSGWKWQDNGYGSVGLLGPLVYFATSGVQTVRVQTREDGMAIDEVVLSPDAYATTAPTEILMPSPEPAPVTLAIPGPDANGDIVLGAADSTRRSGGWQIETDAAAWRGSRLRHPDGGRAKLATALASPANYFEVVFQAQANTPYHLWFHGRADRDGWANDSVFVQFSGSVTPTGGAVYRIGTTSATEMNLEDCKGCGLSGWMWQDNGWGRGVMGPPVYFAQSGPQTMRVQTREDGLAIDQVVLSPVTYAAVAPIGLVSPTTSGGSDPAPAPAPTPTTTAATLKVLHWNIHHGVGTDGVYNLDRIATAIAQATPDVVSLNEVERYTSGWGNEDQPARFVQLLTAKTGRQWYSHFAQRYGNAKGQGNLLLSVYPLDATSSLLLAGGRSAAQATITVNGRPVNVFSTHLDDASASTRASEIAQLLPWASGFGEARILAGDFNASPSASELVPVLEAYYDVWAKAKAEGTAVVYPDNPNGNTRNGRIDYVFLSRGATTAVLQGAQVIDVRDSTGVQPSDHRPLVATFEIR